MISAESSQERTFSLPGGLFVENGRCLRTALLRPLSGREEEWLSRHSDLPSATRVTRLLNACLYALGDEPASQQAASRLLLADRDYLVLQLRRLTLGDSILAVLACPACENRMDLDLKASEVPIQFRPQQEPTYTLASGLDGTERLIRFRLPTGGDQEAVLAMNFEGDVEGAADALLDRCVLEDGGQSLSPEERIAVGDRMAELAPEVELELELVCPECDYSFVAPFDTTAFFLEEMRLRGGHLLREVHTLAAFYHWNEAEILGLVRDRRLAYLDLVGEAMRPE